MVEETSMINWQALSQASVTEHPFPYLIVDHFLNEQHKEALVQDFPSIPYRGSLPLSSLNYGKQFAQLMEELQGSALRNLIEKKFEIDLEHRPTMVTVRGRTEKRDGQIHVDAKSKLITVLLYLNPDWTSAGGCLRLLKNGKDLNDYVAEIPPAWGRCLIFKVTDNCWHGHTRFIGERKSIQLNYVTNEVVMNKDLQKHGVAAKWKAFKFLFTKKEY
jgi:SM-20-related protein